LNEGLKGWEGHNEKKWAGGQKYVGHLRKGKRDLRSTSKMKLANWGLTGEGKTSGLYGTKSVGNILGRMD